MALKPQDEDNSAKPKNTMMIALLAGAALLLCCTCGGAGIGGWFFRDKLGFTGSTTKKDDSKTDQAANDGDKGKGDPDENKRPIGETRKADFTSTAEALYRESVEFRPSMEFTYFPGNRMVIQIKAIVKAP